MKEYRSPFQFSGFTVYKTYSICNSCKTKIGIGIGAVAIHWNNCVGKGVVEALRKAYNNE